jgi:adenylate cyclase
LLWQPTRQGIGRARQLLQEAITLDPKYSEAYRQLGNTHRWDVLLGSSKSPRDSIETAMKMVQKAITLDESNAAAYGTLGMTLAMKRDYDEAIAAAQHGYELEPNSSQVLSMYAVILEWVGRTQEAIQLYEEAMRLEPIPATIMLRLYAASLISAQRYDEAITFLKRIVEQEPNDMRSHIFLTQCYWLSAREEEARAEAAEVLRLDPKFSVEKWARRSLYKDRVKLKTRIDAMREAGLPD